MVEYKTAATQLATVFIFHQKMRFIMRIKFFLAILSVIFLLSLNAKAQRKLYLDLRAGINYNFVEGAYFGKGQKPFKAYSSLRFDEQGVAMLRLQLKDNWGIAAGYSGSTLAWAYSLKVPEKHSVNPYEGERSGISTGRYMHQFPILISKRIGQYNIKEIDTLNHLYLASFRLDAVLGSGLNWNNRTCEDCSSLSGGSLAYDVIEFEETVITKRRFGTFVMGGVTARFYRLGKERLNLSLYYTQGLTDMLLVPVEYRYNAQRGSTTLRIRGSGLSTTLGIPIRLITFGKSGSRNE